MIEIKPPEIFFKNKNAYNVGIFFSFDVRTAKRKITPCIIRLGKNRKKNIRKV